MTVRGRVAGFRLGRGSQGMERCVGVTYPFCLRLFFLAGTMPSFPAILQTTSSMTSTPERVGDCYEGPPGPTVSPSWLVRGLHRDLSICTPTCFALGPPRGLK